MMRTILSLLLLISATAFTPTTHSPLRSLSTTSSTSSTILRMGFGGEPERKKLTRDSEPEDFFSTNTDKMSDQEKIPLAIAGLLGISLPFIFGLIALYSAK
ncbi:hypothetical protein HJC23_012525 [Cyclotella cryptica]|uniref:Uncharacterized protein n=1 Tax=Cyclotella cryptica TaxID=29204 RepID=A0ABD3QSK2_9STRA|eukprot:CCRYP_003135-RA/>CCRYP_003135-RA protein AED:0.47 eAED:0.47 QI:0/-1/0/1/-1/1/1/0/100